MKRRRESKINNAEKVLLVTYFLVLISFYIILCTNNTKQNVDSSHSSSSCQECPAFLQKLEEIRFQYPQNRLAKYLTPEYFNSLSTNQKQRMMKIAASGVQNPDSSVGCYAMDATDYDEFRGFFEPLINDIHNVTIETQRGRKMSMSQHRLTNVLNVEEVGAGKLSMRVRVARNFALFPLPGKMSREERLMMEKLMWDVFERIREEGGVEGEIISLSTSLSSSEMITNPHLITKERYMELVNDHVMFKSMENDRYLKSAGIAADWPEGRGAFISKDRSLIIWYGEEDHLRIMSILQSSSILNDVFERLHVGLQIMERMEGMKFARVEPYGYVTSCPSNLGTAMRASVHLQLPLLTKGGSVDRVKMIVTPLGISVRGAGGEHTPIGDDGTVDISPTARLFITEEEIMEKLFEAIKLLITAERALQSSSTLN